jgi:hypothetical protein
MRLERERTTTMRMLQAALGDVRPDAELGEAGAYRSPKVMQRERLLDRRRRQRHSEGEAGFGSLGCDVPDWRLGLEIQLGAAGSREFTLHPAPAQPSSAAKHFSRRSMSNELKSPMVEMRNTIFDRSPCPA